MGAMREQTNLVTNLFNRNPESGIPPSVWGWRVYVECGCCVYMGKRIDTAPPEVATMASSCSVEHDPLVARFNELMADSLVDGGTDRPLIDVIEELLEQAADA